MSDLNPLDWGSEMGRFRRAGACLAPGDCEPGKQARLSFYATDRPTWRWLLSIDNFPVLIPVGNVYNRFHKMAKAKRHGNNGCCIATCKGKGIHINRQPLLPCLLALAIL